MPEQPVIPAPYTSYQQILSALVASATGVIEILSAEMRAKHALPLEIVTRDFLLLSAVVRRAVAAALHLRTLPPAPEEAAGQITTMLDAVLTAFARHKMDIDTYHRMVDAELDAECDDDDDDEDEDDADDFDPPDDEKEATRRPRRRSTRRAGCGALPRFRPRRRRRPAALARQRSARTPPALRPRRRRLHRPRRQARPPRAPDGAMSAPGVDQKGRDPCADPAACASTLPSAKCSRSRAPRATSAAAVIGCPARSDTSANPRSSTF